jgi:hypothetical protein
MRFTSLLYFYFIFTCFSFGQPNNGITFINNLPSNLPMGFTKDTIIDANGGGGVTIAVGNLEGIYNISIEVYINGVWTYQVSTTGGGIVSWGTGQKMVVNTISSSGNNSCSTISGNDTIDMEDGIGNSSSKMVCIYDGVLPMTYHALNVVSKNNQCHIIWSVASQVNNEKYIIEHSNDERNFSIIGEIAGDGTNNETKHYEYIHTLPSIGINYYRIKQQDYDGKYSYSEIASVRYDGDGETSIYPNPATSEVTISTTEPTSVQVMDVYGRLLVNRDISDRQNTINLSELPTGILIFVVGDQRFKVLKE